MIPADWMKNSMAEVILHQHNIHAGRFILDMLRLYVTSLKHLQNEISVNTN